MFRSTSRARTLAAAAVGAGLCLAGATALPSPSQAATGVCDTAYPVASLAKGQAVHGLTVTSGTQPTSFTGSVIGVLQDGVAPGVDLVMADLTLPDDVKAAGIWEGMSGSPVYAADGSLIGAVAYTLSYGPTSVAGITPWEDMKQYAGGAAPAHLSISGSAARQIARATSVTATQASQGFHELRAPALVSGLSARVLARDTGRPYLRRNVAAAGLAGTGGPTAADMVAGGNLVATASTGDITQGGLGTITSVCNNRVVGFGHPYNFLGTTTYGMAGADALYIQPDSLGPSFKVADIGSTLGTVDQDRMTGISGPLGPIPVSSPITSTVTYHGRSRTGASQVQLPIAAASTANYELVANHQVVLDATVPGSENQAFTVHGHNGAGPYTLTWGNRYTDNTDVTFASVWDLPDLLWLLTNIRGVKVDSVDVTSNVTDSTSVYKIKGAQQWRGGAWVRVDNRHPASVKAGRKLVMRLVFNGGTTGGTFRIPVPAKAAGTTAELDANQTEGFPFEQDMPHTLAGVKRLVATAVRNDQAQLDFFGFSEKAGEVHVSGATPPASKVVTGQGAFQVVVR